MKYRRSEIIYCNISNQKDKKDMKYVMQIFNYDENDLDHYGDVIKLLIGDSIKEVMEQYNEFKKGVETNEKNNIINNNYVSNNIHSK